MQAVEVLHPDLPDLIDALLASQGWSWEAVSRGEAKLDGQPVTMDRLQRFLIATDPVLWGECNLVEGPEDGGGLWQFFDYQKPSLRYRGHVVHQDGAEVGKSRELTCLALWSVVGACRGSVLIGSALDGDLDELWELMELQQARNPYIRKLIVNRTSKPYRRITAVNGLRILLRPAGHDGRAYRAIHVGGLAMHDESAKVEQERAWSEFFRAAKPKCEIRLYSVPTGIRLSRFQRLADSGMPSELAIPATPTTAWVIEMLLYGSKGGVPDATRQAVRDGGKRMFLRFHWPKTIMPPPFWTEERREELIELYGGPDEPGYIHNVLGLPGDPEYSVFPWRLLESNLRHVDDYLNVILRWDTHARSLDALARRQNPAYELVSPDRTYDDVTLANLPDGESEGEIAGAGQPLLKTFSTAVDLMGWASRSDRERYETITDLLRAIVRPLEGDLVGGIDVGSTSVTSIVVDRFVGRRHATVLRLHLRGFGWYEQRDVIWALDELLRPSRGWGIDGTGVGKALYDLLQGGNDSHAFRERLSGYVFNRQLPAINPDDGEPMNDPQTGQPYSVSYKEQGTQLLVRALEAHQWDLPNDPELLSFLQQHTYSQTVTGQRTFRKIDDHDIDAFRCLFLRCLTNDFGSLVAPVVTFKSTGIRRDSNVFMEAF
ncbi:MAG TPA: hypothetical protein VNJ70_17800 [Thermoanaerobaculia bacterium]|nr:hypothetical protein [Thermoanaerobaculia bacterium]